jgi:hypothetical protein
MRAASLLASIAACSDEAASPDVILFSRTTGYRHQDSIEAALAVLPARLEREGLRVTATEDPAALTDLRTASATAAITWARQR